MAAFIDVLLRGLGLVGQALAVGGVAFAWLVARDSPPAGASSRWTLIAAGAAVVGLAQALALVGVAVSLDGVPDGLPRLAATTYFRVTLVRVLAAVALVVGVLVGRRGGQARLAWTLLLGGAVALVVGAAGTSHAAARPGDRVLLLGLDAVHQLAAAGWIGGLAHFLVAVLDRHAATPASWLRRFSTLALFALIALVASGGGLTLAYVDGPGGLIGTAYGVMVLTKVVLFGGLVGLAVLNFLVVRRLRDSAPPPRLGRLVEVEIGIGVTVLLAAASLTSLPPAADVVTDRATPGEVLTRFTPRWPALVSPPLEAVPVDPDAPRTDVDRAWSEYNHHVSGMFVLGMGVLSLVAAGGGRWARHWPLAFLGLAGFMLVRNDPEAWPLGAQGFWAGMLDLTVFQHRLFVALVVVVGVVEYRVRTGRIRAPSAALVFPLLCATGAALLLTHSHTSLSTKTEFLLEVTHAPLGVLGLVVGWGRWLEVRLPDAGAGLPGRLAAAAMIATGLLLLLYRES
jgi:putative copper resistance protein D